MKKTIENLITHSGKYELWLEFGYRKDEGKDMLWYNEGRASELKYFLKNFIKDMFKKDRYYLVRFRKLSIYLK